MLQKIQKNSTILKYVARSGTSSTSARHLICQAFIQPYLQLIYIVWPMLSATMIELIERKDRQLTRLTHRWMDATTNEVRWLPHYQTAESKAQRFLRRFIDKAISITPELFEDYILCKAMPLYLRLHLEEERFIVDLPRGRFNHYITDWINPSSNINRKCYLDKLSHFLTGLPS